MGTAGCSVLGLGGATYPSVSAIEPLAKGDAMIFDVTFPPGGSDNFGDRVVGIGLPKGVPPAEGWDQVLQRLEAKHWTSGSGGLCAPSGDPCADTVSTKSLATPDAFGFGTQAEVNRMLAKLHQFAGSTLIVWFGYT